MDENLESLKFPIGKFKTPNCIDEKQIEIWINAIESFPKKLRKEVENLSDVELEKQYRTNGWTIRQIVHHCADSHTNSFIRFKLALTENEPIIKAYLEDKWAELPDGKQFPIESSLQILEGIHRRWIYLLKNLSKEQMERKFKHPENLELITLKNCIGIYAWHGEHHLAHIQLAKQNRS